MAKNRVKTLVLTCVTMLCCLVLIVGATFALFSGERKVTNHLQSGNLDIQLERTRYEWKYLDDNGFLSERNVDELIDFTKETDANIFGLGKDDLTAPGCAYTAYMRVTNNGSVAFKYWIEIKLDKESDDVLAGQLEVTIKTEAGEKTVLLNADDLVYGKETGIAVVGTKQPLNVSTFTITVKFVNREDNNNAMDMDVIFDLFVHAEQHTDMPENWGK